MVERAPTLAAAGIFPLTAFATAFALEEAGLDSFAEGLTTDLTFCFEGFEGGLDDRFTGLDFGFSEAFTLEDLGFVAIVKSATYNVYPTQSQAGSQFCTSRGAKALRLP